MKTREERMSLLNLGDGAAVEKFDAELARVIRNILDPDAKAGKRAITLKVTVTPNSNNPSMVIIDIDCKSSLQQPETHQTSALIAIDERDECRAHEFLSQEQQHLPGEGATRH